MSVDCRGRGGDAPADSQLTDQLTDAVHAPATAQRRRVIDQLLLLWTRRRVLRFLLARAVHTAATTQRGRMRQYRLMIGRAV